MNAEQNPLLRYGSLLEQYTDRVEPFLTQLRERVDNELDLVRQQEATLIVDRAQALQKLQTEIGVDARFLLKTARFQEFFEQHLNVKSKYNRDKTPQVDDLVANWSLVELAIGVKPDGGTAAAIAECRASGIIFRVHHAFVWEPIHRPFNLSKKLDRDYFQRTIEWLAKMFVTAYSVHPGSYTDCREADWDMFLTNLGWLEKQCSSHNIELGVETMYPIRDKNRRYFLDDLNSIIRLRQIFPDLKWVLDLAHLNLWQEDRLEVINLLKDILLEIHISDNNGYRDLHSKISEKTWWLPYLEILPISVPYVLETRLAPMESSQQIKIVSHPFRHIQASSHPTNNYIWHLNELT